MLKILVSGGAGFLGSHLVEKLLKDGHQVTVLDDVSTGSFANLPSHPSLRVCEQDVCLPWRGDVDQIYHLACAASPPKYQMDPIKTLRTNFVGTQNLLDLATATGARLLFTSTSEVYGDPAISPQVESYWGNVNSFGPRSCYDEGKRVAESLCYSYASEKDVTVRIARIFNTYGPRMARDDGRVVSNFLVQALTGEPLTVYGDGVQTRSLCYVDDLVRGLILLMNKQGVPLEPPVNLGNPHEMTIAEIARLVLDLTNSKSDLVNRPLPQDDPRQRCPDITRARQWLDWQPAVDVRTGLMATAEYFRQQLQVV